jgi:hypothetical protein
VDIWKIDVRILEWPVVGCCEHGKSFCSGLQTSASLRQEQEETKLKMKFLEINLKFKIY